LRVRFSPSLLEGSYRHPGDLVPLLIDEIPVLAILGSQVARGSRSRMPGAGVKESDRSRFGRQFGAMERCSRRGRTASESRRSALRGAAIDSRGDHRIAMAFAVAGCRQGNPHSPGECADISFPGFGRH